MFRRMCIFFTHTSHCLDFAYDALISNCLSKLNYSFSVQFVVPVYTLLHCRKGQPSNNSGNVPSTTASSVLKKTELSCRSRETNKRLYPILLGITFLFCSTTTSFAQQTMRDVFRLSGGRIGTTTKPLLAIKTNLLYDAIGMPNIEAELYFGLRHSLNIDYQCAWWTFKKSDRFYQIMMFSPEYRYWLRGNGGFCGHFLGGYVGAGYYDLKWKTDGMGYQGELFIAAGVSYGYYLPINDALGLEFSAGVGYVTTKYRKYYRYKELDSHYVYQGKDRMSYLGPTKLKLSLVWRLES